MRDSQTFLWRFLGQGRRHAAHGHTQVYPGRSGRTQTAVSSHISRVQRASWGAGLGMWTSWDPCFQMYLTSAHISLEIKTKALIQSQARDENGQAGGTAFYNFDVNISCFLSPHFSHLRTSSQTTDNLLPMSPEELTRCLGWWAL